MNSLPLWCLLLALLGASALIGAVVVFTFRSALFPFLYPHLVRLLGRMWEATNQNCKHATMPRIDDATASAVVKSATAILLSVPALKAANGNLQTIATDLAAQLSAAQAQLGETDALKAALASANSTIAALDQADANLDNDISELKLAADALTEAVENPPVDTPPVDTPPTDVPPVEVPPTEVPPVETPPVEVPPTEVPAENP